MGSCFERSRSFDRAVKVMHKVTKAMRVKKRGNKGFDRIPEAVGEQQRVKVRPEVTKAICSVANSWQNFPASPAEKFGR
jgi:hypothetical protein